MRYNQIRSLDISNGEYIGVALFIQGCPIHCKNCFNKETWDFKGGKLWTEETENIFLQLIDRPYIKRISILGGEPLCKVNISEVWNLLLKIKKLSPSKKIWVYTGYNFSVIKQILDQLPKTSTEDPPIDILVDGRYIDELKDINYPYAGSTNQRVIDVHKSFKNNSVILYR